MKELSGKLDTGTELWTELLDRINGSDFFTLVCDNCGYLSWPPAKFCNKCNSWSMIWKKIVKPGNLISWTEVVAVPSGFSSPQVNGLVEIGKNKQVFGIIDVDDINGLKNGIKMEMHMEKEGE
ncbi:MAG: Zn-ribbon domain-containing OB-fold protein, partial [Candidatus Hodarchaeales archaeon]